jgi:outer membrane protein OmpA-like peptidoglycan-associated protein
MFSLIGCGVTPRPAELVKTDKYMLDKSSVSRASRAAPQVFKVSQKYYALAEEAYDDGEMEDCAYYATMAAVKFSTAIEHAKRLAAEDRRAKAEQITEEANAVKAKETARLADLNKRIERAEKIIALSKKLESEKQKSAKDKKRIALELKEAKAEAKKKFEAEKKAAAERLAAEKARAKELKQEKEIQELLASAESKIQTAEALDSKTYDPGNLNSAKTFVEQAKQAMANKRYQNAKALAVDADKKAGVAIARSKAEYSKKKKEADLRKEREDLFKAANHLGVGCKQETRGVVLTLYEMFASRKAIVLPERTFLLDQIADLASKYKDYPIVVEGYTDSRGRGTDNLALSQSRAQSVLDYLVQQKKLRFERIKSSGYGEANPVADNSKAKGRAKNRRVELIFLFR